MKKINLSDEEWQSKLTPEQYEVLRKKGTEKAFTGKYNKLKDKGIYTCAACGLPLYNSKAKYDSGTGWPSFYEPIDQSHIILESEKGWLMDRVEVKCASCGSHLGHVFEDGPEPTGKRFCMNSVSLDFKKEP